MYLLIKLTYISPKSLPKNSTFRHSNDIDLSLSMITQHTY